MYAEMQASGGEEGKRKGRSVGGKRFDGRWVGMRRVVEKRVVD